MKFPLYLKVRLIFDKYLEDRSIHKVLKYLLSNNIKCKNGGDFASMSVHDILRNPVYVQSSEDVFKYLKEKGMLVCGNPNGNGILTYNKRNSKYKQKYMSKWIAAVSKHKGTSRKSLLSGILKCAKCGAPMREDLEKIPVKEFIAICVP